jgi:phosphoribosylformimino-5-aminoimidazole carboxamide ribotide isomerase
MLLMPAMDLRGGRCVRLHQGDFARETAYAIGPLELLRRFHSWGARWVHVVDLDGALSGEQPHAPLIAQLAKATTARLQVGGGIRSAAAIEHLLDLGVGRVVLGSAAAQRPQEVGRWLARFGSERICLAFDVRSAGSCEPVVQIHGWRQSSALSLWSALDLYDPDGLPHVLCTDVARDGTLGGPNLELYAAARARYPQIGWQASGGIRSHADLEALSHLGVAAALSGKALLESHLTYEELRPFLPDASFPASTCAPARS